MSRSSSKAINTDTSYDDEFDDESSGEDDQLAFISRKIGTHGRKGVDQTGKDSRNHIEKGGRSLLFATKRKEIEMVSQAGLAGFIRSKIRVSPS